MSKSRKPNKGQTRIRPAKSGKAVRIVIQTRPMGTSAVKNHEFDSKAKADKFVSEFRKTNPLYEIKILSQGG